MRHVRNLPGRGGVMAQKGNSGIDSAIQGLRGQLGVRQGPGVVPPRESFGPHGPAGIMTDQGPGGSHLLGGGPGSAPGGDAFGLPPREPNVTPPWSMDGKPMGFDAPPSGGPPGPGLPPGMPRPGGPAFNPKDVISQGGQQGILGQHGGFQSLGLHALEGLRGGAGQPPLPQPGPGGPGGPVTSFDPNTHVMPPSAPGGPNPLMPTATPMPMPGVPGAGPAGPASGAMGASLGRLLAGRPDFRSLLGGGAPANIPPPGGGFNSGPIMAKPMPQDLTAQGGGAQLGARRAQLQQRLAQAMGGGPRGQM